MRSLPASWLFGLAAMLVTVGWRRRDRGFAAAAALSIMLHAAPGRAADSPYCTRVREQAAGDAALLMSPRLLVQALRFPGNIALEGGTISAQGFQLRAGVAFSATDLYRGLGLGQVADADCRAHHARVALEATVAQGDEAARQAALEAQVSFAEAHAADAQQAVDRAVARFEAHAITLIELEDLRGRAAALERMAVAARAAAAELAAKRRQEALSARAADGLARAYAEASRDFDRAAERVRAAAAWQLDMTAGVIPSSRFDWYGILQLGFNLGGLSQPGHAAAYARAHQQEVAGASYEPAARLAQQRQQLTVAREQAKVELALVERELAVVESTARALAGAEAAPAVHQRDRLALDRLALQAQRAFQDAYVAALQRLLDTD